MEDFEVEDILKEPVKKIKSGQKGKRVERDLCKVLNERFTKILSDHPDWGTFSRSVGSGNRWGQVSHLPQHAKDTYGGDITCPTNFKFVLESKGGYEDIDLNAAFEDGHRQIDAFLQQVEDDSKRSGRQPLLIWKKNRKPRLAFVKNNLDKLPCNTLYYMYYRDWMVINFANLLSLDDSIFFVQ